ncbi:MAG: TetR/AcrR family transcriptional regulator [Saprospiraceae bacterium]|nr:TetR/AcrR family transcriptional regulator [Saprospiraceae bacterium]
MRVQSIASIKEAALELFAAHGYAHTSIAQIARKAGISKGLMYNYFDGKEGLLRAIVSDAISTGDDLMGAGLQGSDDPAEQLTQLIKVSFQMLRENTPYWKFVTSLAFQKQVLDSVQDLIGPKNFENMMAVTPLLASLGVEEPEKEALFFGAAMDGIMMGFLAMGEAYPFDDMEKYLIHKVAQMQPKNSEHKPIKK